FAATRAMAPTGMYPIVSDNWELELPHGVQPVDGVEGARLAVRQQVAHGADWIKFYADRRYYFGADSVLHSWVNFTDDEARAIVDEAHRLGRRVAAHAIGSDGIAAALRAGVNTIEHGDGMTDSLIDVLVAKGVYWVPTVTVAHYVAGPRRGAAGPIRHRGSRRWYGGRSGRRLGRPAQGHHGARAGAVRYEGRGRLCFAIVRRALGASLALVVGAVGPVAGQYTPPGTGGVAALSGALRQLGVTKRILLIGAHPDDEYSDLVALFARGMGAQVAYLSLSRGEGGQNLIGPELGPELGVIRSEELLAA